MCTVAYCGYCLKGAMGEIVKCPDASAARGAALGVWCGCRIPSEALRAGHSLPAVALL